MSLILNPYSLSAAARTFTFVGSCVSNGTSINFSALSGGTLAAGDLLVYVDFAVDNDNTPPTTVTPSGFTIEISDTNSSDPSAQANVSVLKAAGSEGALTGMNGSLNHKVGLVFRPSTSFTTIVSNDEATQLFNLNPSAQTCDPSAETTAVILLGIAGCDASTAAFSTASPAFDGTVLTGDSDLIVGYKIYNTSPASHSIDMADLGDKNWLASLYLTVS